MWRIEPTGDVKVKSMWLLPGQVYKIGRKDCHICLSDQTMSRNHAEISVKFNSVTASQPKSSSRCFITDVSRYGTDVNGQKLMKNSETELKDGDTVKFGTQSSEFRIIHKPLVFVCSGMENSSLKAVAAKIGGVFRKEWKADCTHLVMKSITVTIKVVQALISCQYVVHPKWLQDACEVVAAHGDTLPDPNRFLPEVVEESLRSDEISFAPDDRRKTMFKSLTLIFLVDSSMARKFEWVVRGASGACTFACTSDDLKNMDELMQSNSFVVEPEETKINAAKDKAWIHTVKDYLARRGRCPVSQSEIGLAVLHVSVEDLIRHSYLTEPAVKDDAVAAVASPPVATTTPTPATDDGGLEREDCNERRASHRVPEKESKSGGHEVSLPAPESRFVESKDGAVKPSQESESANKSVKDESSAIVASDTSLPAPSCHMKWNFVKLVVQERLSPHAGASPAKSAPNNVKIFSKSSRALDRRQTASPSLSLKAYVYVPNKASSVRDSAALQSSSEESDAEPEENLFGNPSKKKRITGR